MSLTIRERGDCVATYRYVAVFLMETLARWVPSSPEMEAKTLFGRHIWDMAQFADQLGRRTAELRLALHQSRAPLEGYRRVLDQVAQIPGTSERVAAMYDALIPDYAGRLRAYLAAADPLLDEPTVRIVERGLADVQRMLTQRDDLLVERTDLKPSDPARAERVRASLAAIRDFVDYRADPAVAAEPA